MLADDEEAVRYISVQEIADLFRRPRGTIYRLASEDNWVRVGDGKRPVLYSARDVRRTFQRLGATREATQLD